MRKGKFTYGILPGVLTAAMFFAPQISKAQSTKTTQHFNQVWIAYQNQTRFSKKWGAWLDLHLRTREDFFTGISQTIIRPGVTYFFSDAARLTAGYAYIRQYPLDPHNGTVLPEHRPWQQFQWMTRYPRLRTMQWFRLEERFRKRSSPDPVTGDAYDFNFRARYNFLLQIPFRAKDLSKGDLSLILNNELHINFGKSIVNNYFDQNRFFVGFAWQVNATDNLQFGYLNVFQQLPASGNYRSINAPRIFYFHNVDFRNKKK
jgi:hypothetical protein